MKTISLKTSLSIPVLHRDLSKVFCENGTSTLNRSSIFEIQMAPLLMNKSSTDHPENVFACNLIVVFNIKLGK